MRPLSKWFGSTPSMPWWIEYGGLAVFVVVITTLRPALLTLIFIGAAYVVGMQILRVIVNDRRGGAPDRP